jgi:hypothetical protein
MLTKVVVRSYLWRPRDAEFPQVCFCACTSMTPEPGDILTDLHALTLAMNTEQPFDSRKSEKLHAETGNTTVRA